MSIFTDRTMSAVADQEQQIRDATVEQVNSAIKKFIDPEKLVTAIAGDFQKSL